MQKAFEVYTSQGVTPERWIWSYALMSVVLTLASTTIPDVDQYLTALYLLGFLALVQLNWFTGGFGLAYYWERKRG
jgi:hypothetical protein